MGLHQVGFELLEHVLSWASLRLRQARIRAGGQCWAKQWPWATGPASWEPQQLWKFMSILLKSHLGDAHLIFWSHSPFLVPCTVTYTFVKWV